MSKARQLADVAGKTTLSGWALVESAGVLYLQYNGTSKFKIDSSGNIVALANVTAYGTV